MKKCMGTMLVVDDEELVRDLCVKTLERMGIAVDSASGAEKAWELLRVKDYDCVLTDISMPGAMDGRGLTEELRTSAPWTDMLIMTGNPTLASAISTLKHGALDYLIKPFAPMALENAVMRCFERRRLSGELHQERVFRQELEAAYSELQKAERAKDAFISVLSHELRTPLAVAISAAELLEKATGAEAVKFLELLKKSLARENELVEDLLLFTRLAPGDVSVRFQDVRVEEMVRALVENYRVVWEEKRLNVEIVRRDLIAEIRADPALLEASFKHLLLNAIRFNVNGGLVRIELRNSADRLEILFSNSGEEIPLEQRAQIFDRFYQVAEHMTRSVGGLGLGLAIVRRAIEAHGGSVTVDAREGGGSEFLVSLPLVHKSALEGVSRI